MNIDPELAASAVTDRTRGLLPVHVFGQPCAMDELIELCTVSRPQPDRGCMRGDRLRISRAQGRQLWRDRRLLLLPEQANDDR